MHCSGSPPKHAEGEPYPFSVAQTGGPLQLVVSASSVSGPTADDLVTVYAAFVNDVGADSPGPRRLSLARSEVV